MFDFHLGDGLTVPSTAVSSPFVVLGKAGQGKTVFLMQLALELIKNNQIGLLYDPYGDLAKDIEERLTTEEAKASVSLFTQEDFLALKKPTGAFLIVKGNTIEDGARATREVANKVIKKAYELLDEKDWLIVDQASDIIDEDLFNKYIGKPSSGPQTILCDETLINYSRKQRDELFEKVEQWVFYKVRNLDGKLLEEHFASPTAKDIAAMQQYHFYFIDNGKAQYAKGVWPVEKI
ncbi:MAG: hypothetical protein ABIG66_01340 [Candidatus Kerfeldbacteria bacterium]